MGAFPSIFCAKVLARWLLTTDPAGLFNPVNQVIRTAAGRLAPPIGARKRIWDKLEARGSTDPAEFLASIVDDPKADASLRVNAANALMPYKY